MIRVRLAGGELLDFEADAAETDGDWLTLYKYEEPGPEQEARGWMAGRPRHVVAQFRDVAVDGWWQVEATEKVAEDSSSNES